VLRADRFSVGLNPDAVFTDTDAFEAAIKESARAASTTERLHRLADAVRLYGGPLLPNSYEEWALGERERLSNLFFEAVGRLIRLLEETGDTPAALEHARHAARVDPLREEGHEHLIRLLAAMGQPAAALRQFKEIERLLDEELGEEPSASLRALARRIEKESGERAAAPIVGPARPRRATRQLFPASPATGAAATMTFLLTDIEGSTRLWEQVGETFRAALDDHHRLLRDAFARHGGQEVNEAGDSFVVAFATAGQALRCAVAAQQALSSHAWPDATGPLRVRMALHSGDVEHNEGEYHGIVLHRASRMLTAAHGGQILVSEVTAGLLRRGHEDSDDLRLSDLGVYRLRDVPTPERLFQVVYPTWPRPTSGR
jgi:class 3 adenylate cyclase